MLDAGKTWHFLLVASIFSVKQEQGRRVGATLQNLVGLTQGYL